MLGLGSLLTVAEFNNGEITPSELAYFRLTH